MVDLYQTVEGDLVAEGAKFAIVASRFNDEIVSGLLAGACECLDTHGAAKDDVVIYRVPGAFEIPSAVSKVGATGRFDAIVSLGALIRGETPHFDFISAQVTTELSRVSIILGVPVAFGVVTCNTMEQAKARIERGSNKGWEAALAAIEMTSLYRKLG